MRIGGGDGANPIRLHLRNSDIWDFEHEINLPGDEVVHRRRGALVRDRAQVDPSMQFQELASKLLQRCTGAAGHRSGLRLRRCQQLRHGARREFGVGDQDEREAGEPRYRGQIGQRSEIKLVDDGIDDDRPWSAEDDRVTVGGGARRRLHADVARGAWAVIDEDRLLQTCAETLSDDARNRIRGPARRKRHDPSDRLRRIVCSSIQRTLRADRRPSEDGGKQSHRKNTLHHLPLDREIVRTS